MQIKNRQKFLAVIAITALVLLAGDSLVVEPLLKTWNQNQTRIAELKKYLDQGNQLLDRKSEITKRWTRMERNTLPSDESQAQFQMITAFDRWSRDSRISVSSIKSQRKQTDDDFVMWECRVDASGTIDTITRFLYEVKKTPLAIRVDSVELASHDNNGQQLSLALTVSGLILTPQQ